MNLNFLSHPAGRIGLAVVFAAVVFVVGNAVFREPQILCAQSAEPGYSLNISTKGVDDVSLAYGLNAFTVSTGRHSVYFGPAKDGSFAVGTLTVTADKAPVLTLTDKFPEGFVRVDRCGAFAEGDTYAVEEGDTIAVYRDTDAGTEPTGFTLTRDRWEGDGGNGWGYVMGVFTHPFHAIVSPNGMYVAYITWDEEKHATVLGVAEVSGKNNVVLAELTPEQGEMVLEELSWSGSKMVVYAELVPMVDGPDKYGNMHEKTLYEVNVSTHVRGGIHLDAVP